MSNFSFLEGASHPEELVARAAELGYSAIGIADRNTLAGAVRAFVAARDAGVRLVLGSRVEVVIEHGSPVAHETVTTEAVAAGTRGGSPGAARSGRDRMIEVILLPTDLASYGRLCRLLSRGRAIGSATLRRDAADSNELFRLPIHVLLERAPKPRASPPSGAGGGAAAALHEGLQAIVIAPRGVACMEQWFLEALAGLRSIFDQDRLSLAVWRLCEPDGELRVRQMQWLWRQFGIPLVAINDVHMHDAARRPVQDVLTCVRHGVTIARAGARLFPNAERHLRSPADMAALFADLEREAQKQEATGPLARAGVISQRCAGFSLDQIRSEYPSEIVPGGSSAMETLRRLVEEGAAMRYPAQRDPVTGLSGGVPPAIRRRLDDELALIDELGAAPYFLTVADLVRFARSRGILCQGRGAAANSAVCFVLGITAVDPARIDTLFERFMSRERQEPPDIDVDFEHERREEVIQYIYAKYGRDRAAIAAEVISYRGRSAIRDVGKALGMGVDAVDRLAGSIDWWHRDLGDAARDDSLRQLGFDPRDPTLRRVFQIAGEILGFPRHLSQHVGGFVITEGALCELVPVRAAAMPERTIIEWDKDDLDAMGLMKVDVLALGMLTCIRKAIDLVNDAVQSGIDSSASWTGSDGCRGAGWHAVAGAGAGDAPPAGAGSDAGAGESVWDAPPAGEDPHRGTSGAAAAGVQASAAPPLEYHSIPAEDPRVYDMICRADTVGVFQIESRAQMSMLPRLRPRCYYDLVIEVAIVRPGPIVGDMVHPYLRRRNGEAPVEYPNETIRRVLGRTLGVPLFQEQAMSLAVVAAGFTPGEADQLRRAIAAWKRMGGRLAELGEKLIGGMLERGYERAFAEQVFRQIQGFSGYGFPESHAASFALLVYVSAWLKCHHPAAFAAALINSQPMGFYAPAQIIADAREHGVEVREIDVNASAWDCALEPAAGCGGSAGDPALRLGLRLVSGLPREDADRVVDAVRRHGPFRSIEALWRESGVPVGSLRRLARADAFRAMGFPRQQALWQIRRLRDDDAPLFAWQHRRGPACSSGGRSGAGVADDRGGGEWRIESIDAAAIAEVQHAEVGCSISEQVEAPAPLPPVAPAVEVSMDYGAIGLSLKAHPMSFLRERLTAAGASPCRRVRQPRELPSGSFTRLAGIVLVRQRPATARGVVFMTIEDETGPANLILKPKVYARFRREARHSVVVLVEGTVERRNEVCHLLVRRLRSLDAWMMQTQGLLAPQSRDFH